MSRLKSFLPQSIFDFTFLFSSNIFKKILGFFREIILAFVFGSSIIYANYILLKTITDFLSQFAFGNALQANLLPKFTRLFEKHKNLNLNKVYKFSKKIGLLIFLISFLIQLLIIFFVINKHFLILIFTALFLSFILSTNFLNSIFLTIIQSKGEYKKFSIATSLNILVATILVYPFSFFFSVLGTSISRLIGVLSLIFLYVKPLLNYKNGYDVKINSNDFNFSVLIIGNVSLFILLFGRFIIGLNGSNDITHFNYSFVLLNVFLTAFVFNINTILLRKISSKRSFKIFFVSLFITSLIASFLYFIVNNLGVELIDIIYKRGAFSTSDVYDTAYFLEELMPSYIVLMFTSILFQPFFSLGIKNNSNLAEKFLLILFVVFILLTLFLYINNFLYVDASLLFIKVMSITALLLSIFSYIYFLKHEIY